MNVAKFLIIFFLGVFLFGCSFNQKKRPVNPDLLPGKYGNSVYSRDSIFVYSDSTYIYKFYRSGGGVDSLKGNWRFKSEISSIFFDDFRFYSDLGPADISKGTWAPEVSLTDDGEVKLRYSEDVYYAKVREN